MPSEKAPSRKYFTAASLDRRLGLRKPGQDVERDRHRLEADEERDQVGAAGHEHHAERGAENQEVILTRPRALHLEIASRDISTVSAADAEEDRP